MISTARMDPVNFGWQPDVALLHTRLHKMTTKNLGILYYGPPQKGRRSSVMYGPILGLRDLDRMGEEF